MSLAQLPGVEGGHAPVLAVGKEVIGRRAHAHVRRQQVLPAPRVAAVGCESHRYIGDQADLLRGSGELAVEVELQPLVKGHPPRERPAYRRAPLAAWMAQLGRPAAPRRPQVLGDGAERRVVLERPALAAYPGLQARGFGRDLEDGFER